MALYSPRHTATALKPRSLLIATDFSEASEQALRHSLSLARFYGSRFCLAHVVSSLGLTIAGPGAIAACEEAVSREAAELEDSLVRTGVLTGVQHKFVVRHGELWPELQEIIRQEGIDLLVVGTHGRRGMGKLFFGSVAEEIFRQAGCPVIIFGPGSQEHPGIGSPSTRRTFLFATDFGQASLHGLPQAVAVANHFGAKLAFLDIICAVPPPQSDLHSGSRQKAWHTALQRMTELAGCADLDAAPECLVESESRRPVGESILQAADTLGADLIIMGLHDSACRGGISHINSSTAYDVACLAGTPVMTVNYPSGNVDIRPRHTEIAASTLSRADSIRVRGLGVKW
jgi:nucleotide-binding universal stress UspA family protein